MTWEHDVPGFPSDESKHVDGAGLIDATPPDRTVQGVARRREPERHEYVHVADNGAAGGETYAASPASQCEFVMLTGGCAQKNGSTRAAPSARPTTRP